MPLTSVMGDTSESLLFDFLLVVCWRGDVPRRSKERTPDALRPSENSPTPVKKLVVCKTLRGIHGPWGRPWPLYDPSTSLASFDPMYHTRTKITSLSEDRGTFSLRIVIWQTTTSSSSGRRHKPGNVRGVRECGRGLPVQCETLGVQKRSPYFTKAPSIWLDLGHGRPWGKEVFRRFKLELRWIRRPPLTPHKL